MQFVIQGLGQYTSTQLCVEPFPAFHLFTPAFKLFEVKINASVTKWRQGVKTFGQTTFIIVFMLLDRIVST